MDRFISKSEKEAGFEIPAPFVQKFKEYKNVKVIDNFRAPSKTCGIVTAQPTVVEEGLLIPIIYTHFDNYKKRAEDLLYYMIIKKDVLKDALNLIKEHDDDK